MKKNSTLNRAQMKNNKSKKGPPTSEAKTVRYDNPNNMKKFVFKKREFISNILATEDFTAVKFSFNPGISTSFPWLSGVATSFEKYVVKNVRFYFETSCPTIVAGTVMMAPEFNVTDPIPESKQELLEYAYATRSPIWQNFEVKLQSKDIMSYKDYYIRGGMVPEGNDPRLYDPFYWIVAVDGAPDSINDIGELWIEYEIELSLPQRINNFGYISNFKQFDLGPSGVNDTFTLGQTVTLEAGTANVLITQDNLGYFTFPEGFSGIMYYTVFGDGIDNYQELATVGEDCIRGGLTGTKGTQLSNNSVYQVSIVCTILAQPGGTLEFSNDGFESVGSSDGAVVYFWNNVYRF